MRTFIPSMLLTLASVIGGVAQANNDPCEAMQEQYDQVCVNPQVSNRQGVVLITAACTVEAIAIRQCEAQNGSQEAESNDSADDSDDDSQ